MAWTDCYLMFLLALTSFSVNSHPVPKNDLISGDDFLSILIRGDRHEDNSRVARYRRPPYDSVGNKETPLPLEALFAPYQDRVKFYEKKNDEKDHPIVSMEATTSSFSSTEITTEESTTSPTTLSSSSSEETTTPTMEVVTSVEISSSVQEEIKIHTKRPKAKALKTDDSAKSYSSHFQTIISAPELVTDNESEFLYSSIPRSRMQRKQDNQPSPYQIIHHDDQGTISFSSLNISPKETGQKQRSGSWWWYGWNYPHLAKSSTTTSTEKIDNTTTEEIETTTVPSTTTSTTTTTSSTTPSTTTTTTTTTTDRIILHDLNKIPYDKLNAPVDDNSQNNDLHSALGKFVPSSCKQHPKTTSDEIKSPNFRVNDDIVKKYDKDGLSIVTTTTTNTNEDFTAEEQKTDDDDDDEEPPHSYRSTEEEDDAKFGYVVEGRNYRKYRVEEKTSDGYLVGEYGVLSHNDGSLRGVRYTADSNINPRLIHDALMKFLSL